MARGLTGQRQARLFALAASFAVLVGGATSAQAAENSFEQRIETAANDAGRYVSDSVISNKIRAKILGDKTLSIAKIDVTTEDGVVKLRGQVPSADQKAHAEQLASSVDGVKSIENDLVTQ